MKQLLFTFLLFPLLSMAQKGDPYFANDTLHTSGGYTIYKGRVLQFANGTSAAGYFKYLKFHTSMSRNDTYILQNSTILVDRLRNFKNPGGDGYNIRITGTATYKDGRQAPVDIILEFENASTSYNGLAAELIIPAEYGRVITQTVDTRKPELPTESQKEKAPADLKKLLVADEIKKLFDLYKAGALTKEEYEAQKKKLLDRQ